MTERSVGAVSRTDVTSAQFLLREACVDAVTDMIHLGSTQRYEGRLERLPEIIRAMLGPVVRESTRVSAPGTDRK